MSFLGKQIANKNYLSPVGFKFNIVKTPKVDFFSNSAKIPGIQLGNVKVGNYLKAIDLPGDNIQFEDLTLQFIVDENLENYLEIHNWIYGLGYPESQSQFTDLRDDDEFYNDRADRQNPYAEFSDATLEILDSNFNPVAYVKLEDMFPVSLSTVQFDAAFNDITYLTAQVTFKYRIFQLLDKNYKKV